MNGKLCTALGWPFDEDLPVSASGMLLSNRYRLDRLLGEGGMGAVWSAWDERMRRKVAIKLLRSAALPPDNDPEQVRTLHKRLVREARAAAAVDHPGVVQMLDVVDAGGNPFLVMELLEGRSLRQVLEQAGRLDVTTSCALLAQVAGAVHAAHERGIVHRDLKPENIFLTNSGLTGGGEVTAATQVKLLDFGIAKVLRRTGGAATDNLTGEGHLLGSLPYMSPEQAYGEDDIDHRTDLWSLGIVLYECLSGVLPTGADNTGKVLKIITQRGVTPIQEIAPEVPGDIARLLGRLLARDPGRRPRDMGEVLAVLSRDPSTRPPSSESRGGPSAEDSLQGLVLARLPAQADSAATTVPVPERQPRPEPRPAARTTAPAPTRRTGLLLAFLGLVLSIAWPGMGPERSSEPGVPPIDSLNTVVLPATPATPRSPSAPVTAAPSPLPLPSEPAPEGTTSAPPALPAHVAPPSTIGRPDPKPLPSPPKSESVVIPPPEPTPVPASVPLVRGSDAPAATSNAPPPSTPTPPAVTSDHTRIDRNNPYKRLPAPDAEAEARKE